MQTPGDVEPAFSYINPIGEFARPFLQFLARSFPHIPRPTIRAMCEIVSLPFVVLTPPLFLHMIKKSPFSVPALLCWFLQLVSLNPPTALDWAYHASHITHPSCLSTYLHSGHVSVPRYSPGSDFATGMARRWSCNCVTAPPTSAFLGQQQALVMDSAR
jgi:hypothetical protein